MDFDFASAILWGGISAFVFGLISHLLKKRKRSNGEVELKRPLDKEPQ